MIVFFSLQLFLNVWKTSLPIKSVPIQKNTSPSTTHAVALIAFKVKLSDKKGITIKLIQLIQARKIKIHPIFKITDFFM